jgi:hypothetical protein
MITLEKFFPGVGGGKWIGLFYWAAFAVEASEKRLALLQRKLPHDQFRLRIDL